MGQSKSPLIHNHPTLLQVFTAIILTVFLFSGSVVLTLNFRPLYYSDIHRLNISESSGYPEDVIRKNYDILIDYNSVFNHKPLNFTDFAMSAEGRIHFEEVKHIFSLLQWAFIISGIFGVVLIYIHQLSSKTSGIRNLFYLKLSAILSLILPVLAALAIAVNWEWVFVTFHKLVFNNDYWIFDFSTDPIITILPDAFFMHCALMILAVIAAGCGLFFLLYRRLSGKSTK